MTSERTEYQAILRRVHDMLKMSEGPDKTRLAKDIVTQIDAWEAKHRPTKTP
jgi:hypothetical protein